MEIWIVMALAFASVVLLVALVVRKPPAVETGRAELMAANERIERELRREISESSRSLRGELTQTLAAFQQALMQQAQEATRTQNAQIDAFSQQLVATQKTISDSLRDLSEANARRISEVRATLETQLTAMQQTNAAKLEEMRRTVDEKLQTT
ncbi:MAG TPA: DNA recombination protein RmuC, partial [Ramlibacter sp.]|nr:DNA recombination protein RmuC [Ramlibacter sp.]